MLKNCKTEEKVKIKESTYWIIYISLVVAYVIKDAFQNGWIKF